MKLFVIEWREALVETTDNLFPRRNYGLHKKLIHHALSRFPFGCERRGEDAKFRFELASLMTCRRALGAAQAEMFRREHQRSSDQGNDAEHPEAIHERE